MEMEPVVLIGGRYHGRMYTVRNDAVRIELTLQPTSHDRGYINNADPMVGIPSPPPIDLVTYTRREFLPGDDGPPIVVFVHANTSIRDAMMAMLNDVEAYNAGR